MIPTGAQIQAAGEMLGRARAEMSNWALLVLAVVENHGSTFMLWSEK